MGAIDVWLAKRGQATATDAGPRAKWGHLLEPVIRDDFADRHGVRIEVPGTLVHPAHPRHLATPDGVVYTWGGATPLHGLEIKTHTEWLDDTYGEPGSDDVPLHELLQCQWNMWVSGLRLWALVAFMDGLPADYWIPADDQIHAGLADAADRFWTDCVLGGKQPDPDGSNAYRRYLLDRHTAKVGSTMTASAGTDALVAELRDHMRQRIACQRAVERARQRVQAEMGEHDALESAHGRITWRTNATGSRVFRVPRSWGKDINE